MQCTFVGLQLFCFLGINNLYYHLFD
uniref:Uncharacterized protein n=1 Tax=Arundo donax TaxID=35708 RepID=A0A0A9AW57_ARUDO